MSIATVDWIEDTEAPSPQRCKVIVSGATDKDVRRQTNPCRQQDGTFAALGVVEAEAVPCSAI